MEKVDVVILGAGIAGLGAALKARELGRLAVIFEANARAGGLLDSFEVRGFRFDNAVHLSFASEPEVRKIFDRTEFFTHKPDAWNFERDRWLKHPVQNNLFPLPAEEKVELIQSFLNRPEQKSDDYESWLRHQYGDKIAERYPLVYTKKYWGTEARTLSTTWINSRVRRARLDEILLGALSSTTPNTYYVNEMRYPRKGGYRAFIEPLIFDSQIRCNHVVCRLDPRSKTVYFSNGNKVQYRVLVSSLPLPEIVSIIPEVPSDVLFAAEKLKATSIDLISVGFNREVVDKLWFYIYDEDIIASRVYSPSFKSRDNVPVGCSSLQFEVYSRGTNSKYGKEFLIENVLYAIRKMRIASETDIVLIHHKHIKYGNVIFDLEMERSRGVVRDYFRELGVNNVGRFGEWDYLWSNQSFMSGYCVEFGH